MPQRCSTCLELCSDSSQSGVLRHYLYTSQRYVGPHGAVGGWLWTHTWSLEGRHIGLCKTDSAGDFVYYLATS